MPYEYRVENMKVGDTGYLHIDDIIVTKKAVFIDLISMVESYEDIKDLEEVSDYIPIKRIGKGLTGDDFEIDFSKSDDCFSIIMPKDTYLALMEESENHLIFFDFKIGKNSQGKILNLPCSSIDQLRSDLKIALENEEYEKAAMLRNKIDLLKKEGK
ncbi:MAG: UvrB/UvrC motif-containing protein [Candidatus Pacebacteria bacterium]|nr:UvrB/UvrC motif-containing protein [Candidatus Paceibacterota bacterium]